MSIVLRSIGVILLGGSIVAIGVNDLSQKHKVTVENSNVSSASVDALVKKMELQTAYQRASVDPDQYKKIMNKHEETSKGSFIVQSLRKASAWFESKLKKTDQSSK